MKSLISRVAGISVGHVLSQVPFDRARLAFLFPVIVVNGRGFVRVKKPSLLG